MPSEKVVQNNFFEFYQNLDYSTYLEEKRRLQLELLNLQHWIIDNNKRVAITLDGRDAAGKGSSIKRITEYMMPKHFRIVELGIPTPSESKYWFRRYEKHLPKPGEIVFFDRSWYNRATIEPTMGYCKKNQYKYFMNKVLDWEENLIDDGLILKKLYLSVDKTTQLVRFKERLANPLKYWKYSKNDEEVRQYWDVFTNYKEQMFQKTSSEKSPWNVIGSNNKLETRLKCMLYIIDQIPYNSESKFVPLAKEKNRTRFNIQIEGVDFKNLNYRQYKLLKTLGNYYAKS